MSIKFNNGHNSIWTLMFILLIVLTSCQPVLRLITGAKKPKLETKASLINWLEENEIPYNMERILYVDKDDLEETMREVARIPLVLIFNKDKILLNNPSFCLPQINDSINYVDRLIEFNSSNHFLKSDTKMFHFFENKLKPYTEKDFKLTVENDYLVLIFWSKYMGKKMNLKLIPLLHSIENRGNLNYYLVNMDIQKAIKIPSK